MNYFDSGLKLELFYPEYENILSKQKKEVTQMLSATFGVSDFYVDYYSKFNNSKKENYICVEREYTDDKTGAITGKSCIYDTTNDGNADVKEYYSYNENGDLDYKTYTIFDSNGNLDFKEQNYYNENGDITSKYYDYDIDDDGNIDFRETFYYDENGKINYESNIIFDDNGNPVFKEYYDYDENGMSDSSSIVYDEEGQRDFQMGYSYDENHNIISQNYSFDTNNDGNFDCIEKVMYDENGNVKSKLNIDLDDAGNIAYSEHSDYNEDGELISGYYRCDIDGDGQFDHENYTKYDENGNIETNAFSVFIDGNLSSAKLSYYDENGYEYCTVNAEYTNGVKTKEIMLEDENEDGINDVEIVKTFNSDGEVIDSQCDYTFEIDGVIGNSKQNTIGDCWLLAGLNAFAASEAGAEIIKNSITINDDDTYSVYFKGIDKSYTITKEEIIEAKSKDIYSKGDADMLLMELAFEKVFNEKFKMLTGNKELNNDIWNIDISELLFSEEHALHGGQYQYVTYLLTGEKTNRLTNKEFLNASLKENLIYVTFLAGATLTDIEGNEAISLAIADGSHGCSIKAIEGDVVTIVNPWDSGKEIKVKTDDLIKCNNKIFFALNMSKEKTKWQEFWSNLKNSFVLFYNGLFSESNA